MSDALSQKCLGRDLCDVVIYSAKHCLKRQQAFDVSIVRVVQTVRTVLSWVDYSVVAEGDNVKQRIRREECSASQETSHQLIGNMQDSTLLEELVRGHNLWLAISGSVRFNPNGNSERVPCVIIYVDYSAKQFLMR